MQVVEGKASSHGTGEDEGRANTRNADRRLNCGCKWNRF